MSLQSVSELSRRLPIRKYRMAAKNIAVVSGEGFATCAVGGGGQKYKRRKGGRQYNKNQPKVPPTRVPHTNKPTQSYCCSCSNPTTSLSIIMQSASSSLPGSSKRPASGKSKPRAHKVPTAITGGSVTKRYVQTCLWSLNEPKLRPLICGSG